LFHVVHKDADPFVVESGSAQFVDLGTAFNVVRGAGRTAVAVSEGIVAYNPKGANIRMTAGQGLEARDGDREAPKVQAIDPASIGGWRSGLLVYNGAPLALVAVDLDRKSTRLNSSH